MPGLSSGRSTRESRLTEANRSVRHLKSEWYGRISRDGGNDMRHVTATLVLALGLLGCSASGPMGEQVPLNTDATVSTYGQGCALEHEVVDMIADPTTGMPLVKGGPFGVRWPKGFTAWRAGTEVEIRDGSGRFVLRTGARYSICPADYTSGWLVGGVTPCADCPLGFDVD